MLRGMVPAKWLSPSEMLTRREAMGKSGNVPVNPFPAMYTEEILGKFQRQSGTLPDIVPKTLNFPPKDQKSLSVLQRVLSPFMSTLDRLRGVQMSSGMVPTVDIPNVSKEWWARVKQRKSKQKKSAKKGADIYYI